RLHDLFVPRLSRQDRRAEIRLTGAAEEFPTMIATTSSGAFVRPARFGAAEWQARVQLAAAYRIFDHLGWTELIYNHISLRVPGEESHYLINPFGLHY